MSLISINNLTFCYDGSYDNVFENVSFQIDTDWKLGFTGRNGRGKTTFLNLLMGKYEYSGSISKNVCFDYFPYEVPDKSLNSFDILSIICADAQLWEIVRELSLLEVDDEVLYRPFDTLSNGEQTKVLLAGLFLNDNHYLLIDEPTNHLDAAARQVVGAYLNSKKEFILVSHDRAFLDCCVDHILSINKTDIDIQKGNFTSWLYNKKLEDDFETQKNDTLKKDIKRLNEASQRTSKWSDKVEASKIGSHVGDRGAVGHKAAKMMKRSKSIQSRRQDAVDEKSRLLKNIESADSLKLYSLDYHANAIASVENVCIKYGDKPVCENVSFSINNGDRVALSGKNGSGKTSLLKLIAGEPLTYEGNLLIGSGVVISYVAQDTSFLNGTLDDYADECRIDQTLFKTILRKLDFLRTQFEKDIKDFSEGQKKKVLLARSLCERAHLYIWDEPLNFIDVLSRMQIEELILEYRPTLLFVEHDISFVGNIATKRVEL